MKTFRENSNVYTKLIIQISESVISDVWKYGNWTFSKWLSVNSLNTTQPPRHKWQKISFNWPKFSSDSSSVLLGKDSNISCHNREVKGHGNFFSWILRSLESNHLCKFTRACAVGDHTIKYGACHVFTGHVWSNPGNSLVVGIPGWIRFHVSDVLSQIIR